MTNEKQLSKLLGILVEHMLFFKNLSTEDAQWVIQNPKEAINLFIKAVAERGKVTIKGFTFFNTFSLEAVPEHNTKDCFQNGEDVKYWRDDDLDTWTPKERKAHSGGEYKAESLTESADYREMAMHVLNVEDENISNEELMRRLKEEGHTVEMEQIEHEIERLESGATDTSLAKDGRITFFFIENYDGSVSVVHVYWDRVFGEWLVYLRRFVDDDRWSPGYRVVSRNSSELSS